MAAIPPTPVTVLPPEPSTNNPGPFASLMDAFLAALPLLRTEFNAGLTNAYNNAVEAYNNAVAAAYSAASAAAQVALATTQVALATTQANAASVSALTAINAPGTSATSTTSATIGTGSKSLTIQSGKSLVPGMTIVAADTAAADTNAMTGIITSYNSGTGALVFTVSIPPIGSGTKTDWTVSLSPPVVQTPKLNPTSYYLATL